MEFRRCQPPCARFIAPEDPHSKCIKCLGFSHARDAVYEMQDLRGFPSHKKEPCHQREELGSEAASRSLFREQGLRE